MSRAAIAALLVAALAGASAVAVAVADDEPRYPDGAATFKASCAVCHRPNGAGTPGLAPPVTTYPPRFVATAEGRRQLALTVLYGMYGDIVVDERHYNFKMPEFAQLDDVALATVLNHVIFDLGHAPAEAKPIDAATIAAERATPMDGAAVRAHRAAAIEDPAP
jgi:mono/diheme cytochrome c family protein